MISDDVETFELWYREVINDPVPAGQPAHVRSIELDWMHGVLLELREEARRAEAA